MATGDVELSIVVPAAVAAEVAQRLQERYPDVIADATNLADAMRRVVGWWTANLLADSAALEVQKASQAQVDALQSQAAADMVAARAAAWERITAVLATQPDMAAPPPDAPPVDATA